MKILFTGGGTGGHFYPIVAVAEAVREKVKERKIFSPKLYYMAPTPYNQHSLFENGVEFVSIQSGKFRRYFSILNFSDFFKTIWGCLVALVRMYFIYPDVVFSKGGYGAFPSVIAAGILNIPVIIHESDSRPGIVNRLSGMYAQKIALSYPEAASYFKHKDRIAITGNPIRTEITQPLSNGANEFLNLESNIPVVVILGGSQGSQIINDIIMAALPELLNTFQVIHQTGRNNFDEIKTTSSFVLKDHQYSYRYHPFDYLGELALRMSAGVASVIVSRAGSTIFEIAAWGVPSIIIPLPNSISHDQAANALAYGRTGAASVIEENNLSAHVLIEEIARISNSAEINGQMREKAKSFARLDSASVVADALLDLALSHEK